MLQILVDTRMRLIRSSAGEPLRLKFKVPGNRTGAK